MGPQLYRCGNVLVTQVPGLHTPGASMGPQLYRCGNVLWRHWLQSAEDCFNGAATLSLRKCSRHASPRTAHSRCFNGAATLSLRKCGHQALASTETNLLQWGRNFIVAEMHGGGRQDTLRGHASMGPQLYRCGNRGIDFHGGKLWFMLQWGRNFIVAEMHGGGRQDTLRGHASMGPQLYRCGNMGKRPLVHLQLHASMGPQLYRCGNREPLPAL